MSLWNCISDPRPPRSRILTTNLKPFQQLAGKEAPAAPRQVHPTASSLGSHRVLPAQLNAGPQLFSTVSETKTARPPCAASLWKTGGNRQGATLLARGIKPPLHPARFTPIPTASSLSSHRVLPVQLYAGPQLFSTVSETKTARHPCAASLWKTGGNRQGATLLVRGKKAPAAPRQVHPTASSLGSHRVLPVQLYAGPQLLSTVSETKTERHPCSAPLRIGKLAASARARLQVGFVTAVVTNEEGRRNRCRRPAFALVCQLFRLRCSGGRLIRASHPLLPAFLHLRLQCFELLLLLIVQRCFQLRACVLPNRLRFAAPILRDSD